MNPCYRLNCPVNQLGCNMKHTAANWSAFTIFFACFINTGASGFKYFLFWSDIPQTCLNQPHHRYAVPYPAQSFCSHFAVLLVRLVLIERKWACCRLHFLHLAMRPHPESAVKVRCRNVVHLSRICNIVGTKLDWVYDIKTIYFWKFDSVRYHPSPCCSVA